MVPLQRKQVEQKKKKRMKLERGNRELTSGEHDHIISKRFGDERT